MALRVTIDMKNNDKIEFAAKPLGANAGLFLGERRSFSGKGYRGHKNSPAILAGLFALPLVQRLRKPVSCSLVLS